MKAESNFSELTDEEAAARLSGEGMKGPRVFRGRELAPYTAGARDLVLKVVSRADNKTFHDCVVCFILSELHAVRPDERFAKRRLLIAATDDPDSFRAKVSMEYMDALSDPELIEARRIVDEILAPVAAAQVAVQAKPGGKSKKAAGSRPTKTR